MPSDDIIIISVTCAAVGLIMISIAILGYIYIWKQKRKLQTIGYNSNEVIRIASTKEKSANDKKPITNMEDTTTCISTVNSETDQLQTADKVQRDEHKDKISDKVISERESYPKFVTLVVGNEKVSKSKPSVSTKIRMSGNNTSTNDFACQDGDQDTTMQDTNQRIVSLFTARTESMPESTKTDQPHKTKKIKKSRSKSMKSISRLENETSTKITTLTRNETVSIPVDHSESEHLKGRSDSLVNTFVMDQDVAASRNWEDLNTEIAYMKDSGCAGDTYSEKDTKHLQLKEKTKNALSDTTTSLSISPVLGQVDQTFSIEEVQKEENIQDVFDPDHKERTNEIPVIAILPFDHKMYNTSSQTSIYKEANDALWRSKTPQPSKTNTLEKPTRLFRCKSVPSNMGLSSTLRNSPGYQASGDHDNNNPKKSDTIINPERATTPSQCVQNGTNPVPRSITDQRTGNELAFDLSSETLNVDKENKVDSTEHVLRSTVEENKVKQTPISEPKGNDEQEEIITSSDNPSSDLITHMSVVPYVPETNKHINQLKERIQWSALNHESDTESMTSDNNGLIPEAKDSISTTCQPAGSDSSIEQSNGRSSLKHIAKGVICDDNEQTSLKESSLENETNAIATTKDTSEGGLVGANERLILINRSHSQSYCATGSKSNNRKRKYSLLRSATPIPTTEAKPKKGILKRSKARQQLSHVRMPEENEEEIHQDELVSGPSRNVSRNTTKRDTTKPSESPLEILCDENSENTQQTSTLLSKTHCFIDHDELKDIPEKSNMHISYDVKVDLNTDEWKTIAPENPDANTDGTNIRNGLETSVAVPNESTVIEIETTMGIPPVSTESNESLPAFENFESSGSVQSGRSEPYLNTLTPTDAARVHPKTDSYAFTESVDIPENFEENQDENLSIDSGLVLYAEVSDSEFLVDNQANRDDESQDANKDNHKLYQNTTNDHMERVLEDDTLSTFKIAHPPGECINHHNSGSDSSELKSALHLENNGRTNGKDGMAVTSHLSKDVQAGPVNSGDPAYQTDAVQYVSDGNKGNHGSKYQSNKSVYQTDSEVPYFDGSPIHSEPNGFQIRANERDPEGRSSNETEKSKGSNSILTKGLLEEKQDMAFNGKKALNKRGILDSQHLEIRSLANSVRPSEKTSDQMIDSPQNIASYRKKKTRSSSMVAHNTVRTDSKIKLQTRRLSLRETTSDLKSYDESHTKSLILNGYSAQPPSLNSQTDDNHEVSYSLQSLPKTSSSVFETDDQIGPDQDVTPLTVHKLQTSTVTATNEYIDAFAIETVSKANTAVRPKSSKGRSRSVNAIDFKEHEHTFIARSTNDHETLGSEKSASESKTPENDERPTPANYHKKEWNQSESEIGFMQQTAIPIANTYIDGNNHISNDTIGTTPRSRPKSAKYRSREDGNEDTREKDTNITPADIPGDLVNPYGTSSHMDSARLRSRPRSAKARPRPKSVTIPGYDYGLDKSNYDNENKQSNSNAPYIINTGLKRNSTFQNTRISSRGKKNPMMRSKSVNLHDDKRWAPLSSIKLQGTQNRSLDNTQYQTHKSEYGDETVHGAITSMGRSTGTGSDTRGLTIDVDLDKQVAARRSIRTENGTRNKRFERERPQSSYGRSRGRSFNEHTDKRSRFRPTSACELATPRRITKMNRPKDTSISLLHRNGEDTLSETGDSSDGIEVSTFLIPLGKSKKGEHLNKTSTWSDELHGRTIPSSVLGRHGHEDVSMASKHNTSVGEFQNGSHTNGRVTGIFSRHASQRTFAPEHNQNYQMKERKLLNDKPSATSTKVSSILEAVQMPIARRIKNELSLNSQHTQFTNSHELKQQSPKSPMLGFAGNQLYGSIHQATQPRNIKSILSRSKTMGRAEKYMVGTGNTPTNNVKTKQMLAKSQSFHHKDAFSVSYRSGWHPTIDPVLQDMDNVTDAESKESNMVKTAEKLRAHSRLSNQLRTNSFLF